MKEKTSNTMFYFSYFLIILSDIFNNISFLHSLLDVIDILSILLLSSIILDKIVRKKYTLRELLSSFFLLMIIIISIFISDNRALIKLPFLIIAFKGINFKSFIKKDITFRTILVSFLLVLYTLGFANSGIIEIRNGLIRNSFGTSHPNEFAFYLAMICIDYYYIESLKDRPRMAKPILVSVIVEIVLYLFTGSRTNIFLVGIISIVFIFREKIIACLKNRILVKIVINLFLICLILTLVLTYLYTSNSSFMIWLNDICSNRIFISKLYIDAYGGNKLFGVNMNDTNLPLDNAYINLYLRYGIILTIYFVIIYRKSIKNMIANQEYILVYIIEILLIYGLLETPMYIAAKNPYALLLIYGFVKLDRREEKKYGYNT